MALNVHVARIGMKPIDALGNVVDKDSATIGQMIQTSSEQRVLEDAAHAPNSLGYPSIDDYIRLEAVSGYKVQVINQTMIITYVP